MTTSTLHNWIHRGWITVRRESRWPHRLIAHADRENSPNSANAEPARQAGTAAAYGPRTATPNPSPSMSELCLTPRYHPTLRLELGVGRPCGRGAGRPSRPGGGQRRPVGPDFLTLWDERPPVSVRSAGLDAAAVGLADLGPVIRAQKISNAARCYECCLV
jgi:hypothetical protein